MVVTIIGVVCPFYLFWTQYLGFLKLGSSGSATSHLPGCFCPWPFSLTADTFATCFDSLQGYATEGFQALQRVVLVVFGVVD